MAWEKKSIVGLLLLLSICNVCLTWQMMDEVDSGLRDEWGKERMDEKRVSKFLDLMARLRNSRKLYLRTKKG